MFDCRSNGFFVVRVGSGVFCVGSFFGSCFVWSCWCRIRVVVVVVFVKFGDVLVVSEMRVSKIICKV